MNRRNESNNPFMQIEVEPEIIISNGEVTIYGYGAINMIKAVKRNGEIINQIFCDEYKACLKELANEIIQG